MNEIDLYSQPSYSGHTKLYHITENYKENRLLKFKFREKPTDTPIMVHSIVNKLSMKTFNVPIRSLFFTYTRPLNNTAMRVIPLGGNVQYFYHPDIEDFTAWIYSDIKPDIMNTIEDFIDQYNVNVSHSELVDVWDEMFSSDKELSANYKYTIDKYSILLDKELGKKLAENLFLKLVEHLKRYVEEIRNTDDIDDVPHNTEAEVMIYAPDNIYLIKHEEQGR